MEMTIECPHCTNLVDIDFDESEESASFVFCCPKCGYDRTSLPRALESHFRSMERRRSDFVIQQGMLNEYNGHSYRIDLPASVTFIEGGKRPDNTRFSAHQIFCEEDIVRGCFENNNLLEEFYSTTSLLAIDDYAFANCKNLRKVVLCEGLVSIGRGAFEGCESLQEIQIPITCKSISAGAFRNCVNLKRVRFVNSVSDYRYFPVWIGYDHRVNGLSKFDAWDRYNPDIPDRHEFNLRTIDDWLFFGCSSLSEIDLPTCIRTIPIGCFAYCSSLRSVNLSDYGMLCSIGDSAFYGCTSLKEVKLPTHLQEYPWITDSQYKRDLRIGIDTFHGCTSLESINIPDFVTLYSRPFDGCEKLKVHISNEKMLEDYDHFKGSGPDGNCLNELCLFACARKYEQLRHVKSELYSTFYEIRSLGAQRREAGFFEFDKKSKLDAKIAELNERERRLIEEGHRLDKEAEDELRGLCFRFNVSFLDRFCDTTCSGGTPRWKSFSEWMREALC